MWTPSYDIIVETLTGSEFEVTVNDRDTVGYLKSEIQKYEGIPVSQQHLLYNHKELSDAMEMKDVPLVKGSRVKLVLGMKGGPISSKRLFTISSDYDNWLDMSDVFSGEDLINLQGPGLKVLLYKDNKKNVHRLKVRAEKAGDGMKGSLSRSVIGSASSGHRSGSHCKQRDREAAMMKQKMDQIKAKLSMKKKRLRPVQDGGDAAAEDDGETPEGQQNDEEALAKDHSNGSKDTSGKLVRCHGQYRHKKRHPNHRLSKHHHQYQYHQHQQQQHETVIKEEKTPIGYRPGAGSGMARKGGEPAALVANGEHRSPMIGAIGSMLPSTSAGAHRKSMPAVIDIGRQEQEPAAPPFSYGLVNVLHGSASSEAASRTPTLELEKRSQIREHLQRNRSFKTISAKNSDLSRDASQMGFDGAGHLGPAGGLERSLSFHSNGILSRMNSETTLDGGYGSSRIRRCAASGQSRGAGIGQPRLGGGVGCATTQSLHQLDEKVSSASLHDLIELLKYTHSKQRTISNDSLNKLVLNYSKKMYIPHLYHHAAPGAGVKKSLPDINPSLNNIDEYLPDFDIGTFGGLGSVRGGGAAPNAVAARRSGEEDRKLASAEIAFKNATVGAPLDKTYRTLCKSISDDSSVYQLPKLLVRGDSPVESFLGSYSQLETVALHGDSPKNNFTSASSMQDVGASTLDDRGAATMAESLLEIRPMHGKPSVPSIVGEAKRATESLLQLAQIAAESAKSSSVTPPAAAAAGSGMSSGQRFGSNSSLAAGAGGCGSSGSNGFVGSGVASSSSWCHHWNQRQHHQQHSLQHGLFSSSLQQLTSQPRHHHSDLGINELELKFVHAESLDRDGVEVVREDASSSNVIKLPAIPNLEINTGWMSSWDTLRFAREDEDADDEALDEDDVHGRVEKDGGHGHEDHQLECDDEDEEAQEDRERVTSSSCSSIQRPRRATSNSTSFIHSHLSISSDEDDLLNVAHELGGGGAAGGGGGGGGGGSASAGGSCSASAGGSCSAYKAGSNKSKSIDLNEFRKAFGSSPTLLNGFGGVGTSCTRLAPQLSRLETIPSQYRRGYTNLNDACLSSSTSELECVSKGAAKKKHHNGGGLLPPEDDRSVLSSPLLKYRKNGNIPYVRSNESLNRYKVAVWGASPSSAGSGTRPRSGDSESLGGGDALYLRHRQQSASGAGTAVGGGRHLPGIRDHLASIADSELSDSVGCRSSNNSSHNSTGSNLNEDEDTATSRCLTVGGDFECRFSRLSCCSTTPGGAPKSVSPGAAAVNGHHQRQHASGLSAIGSGGGGLRATASSSSVSAERNHRILFGDEGRSSIQRLNSTDGTAGAGTSSTTTPMRPSDYYFPSDESLFNMDSFFDDFVEIDTSDIFDSAEFININAPGVGARKGRPSSSLLLPDIHQQQQQRHQQEQQQKSPKYLYFHAKEQSPQGQQQLLLNTAPSGGSGKSFSRSVGLRGEGSMERDGEINFSSRRSFMHTVSGFDDDDDDDDDDVGDVNDEDDEEDEEDEGVASIIRHIDLEQLCDQRTPSSSSAAAAVSSLSASSSSLAATYDKKRHSGSSDRLLGFLQSQLPSNRTHSSAAPANGPAEVQPGTTTEQTKSKKLRCAQCNKKLGMVMIMKCHCEKIFCAQHRYAEAHNCSYDFKLEGRKVLEKNNPLVVAEKLPKI